VAKRKPVVPLRIDKEPMRKDFEYFLASCHWLDVTDGGLENHLSGLTRRMRHLLLERAEAEADGKHSTSVAAAVTAPVAAVEEPAKRQAFPAPARRRWRVLGAVTALAIVAAVIVFAVARQGGSESGQTSDDANSSVAQPSEAQRVATPPDRADTIDLLAKFRIPEDVVSGEWTRTADGVHVAGPAPGRANFGDPPAGDYDVHLEFTPLIGDDGVMVVLSRFGNNFAFVMGAKMQPAYGFAFDKGKLKRAKFQQVTAPGPLQNDVRHVAVIEVRRHGATATVDGVPVAKMFTANFGELAIPKTYAIGRNSLGFVTLRSATVHAVRCTPVADGDSDGP
jgi:hypothetical protein